MYKFAKNVYCSEIDNQMVLVEANRGQYFTLNETGCTVAKALFQGRSVDQIVESLTAEFDIEPSLAREDCLILLNDLLSNGLIENQSAQSE